VIQFRVPCLYSARTALVDEAGFLTHGRSATFGANRAKVFPPSLVRQLRSPSRLFLHSVNREVGSFTYPHYIHFLRCS